MNYRFMVITDTHFEPLDQRDYLWWNRMLISENQSIVDGIVATADSVNPDFVLHCGDLASDGRVESFQFGKRNLDRLPCPYYVALGNHDTYQPRIRTVLTELFENDGGSFSYLRRLEGMNLIVLDAAYWINENLVESEHIDRDAGCSQIGPSASALSWLEETLAANPEPTVIALHTPISKKDAYPVGSKPYNSGVDTGDPPDRVLETEPDDFGSHIQNIRNGGNAKTIVARHPQVRLICAGHWHVHSINVENDQVFCTTASMTEYPLEMRLIDIDDESVSIATLPLPDPSLAERSLVPKYKNTFVAGLDEDRSFRYRFNR